MDTDIPSLLAEATSKAAALRASLAGSSPELSVVAASGTLLERFLADLEEALQQVFTAGLAFPDPEIPDELAALATRARALGLPGALEHTLALRALLTATLAAPDGEGRQALVAAAWERTHRLVAWVRLFRTELGFLLVEARLTQTRGATPTTAAEVPTRSLTAQSWGLQLDTSGRLLVFCTDLQTGHPVVLRDHLPEHAGLAPLDYPVVSRLLQDQVTLRHLLRGMVCLDEHPVVERPDQWLFRPAFRAIPRVLSAAEDADPSELPAWPAPIGRLRATAHRSGGRVRWTPSLQTTAWLTLAVQRLMVREGSERVSVDLVVVPGKDAPRPVSAWSADDGWSYPADDPRAWRLAPELLASAADATAAVSATVDTLLLQAAAYLFHGADADAVDTLRTELATARARGISSTQALERARGLLGVPHPDAEAHADLLRAALVALASPGSASLQGIERLLGRRASPSDVQHLDDTMAWETLWLVDRGGLQVELAAEVCGLLAALTAGEGRSTPAYAGARALATHLVEELDGVEDLTAYPYLVAHLDALIPGRSRKRQRLPPLPTVHEILLLGDTTARLVGDDPHGATVAHLGAQPVALLRAAIDALVSWRTSPATPALARRAAHALLLTAASGLSDTVVR